MKIAYTNKTSRRRISSLCVSHAFDKDFVCKFNEEQYLYISLTIGVLFLVPASLIMNESLPRRTNSMETLSILIDGNTKTQTNKNGENITSNAISKQADVFLTMIDDVMELSEDITVYVPSFHALQHCLRSGWQPNNLPMNVLKVAMNLTNCNDLEISSVGRNLLLAALNINNDTLIKQILFTLLNIYKGLHEQSNEIEIILNVALCAFMRQSYATLLLKAGNIALKNTQNLTRNNKSLKGTGTESLGLGDALEILVGDRWVAGTIARSNGITGEFQIEHAYNHRIGSRLPGEIDGEGISSSSSTMVTVLPKTSSRLRLLNTATSAYPNRDTTSSTATTVPTSTQQVLEVDQKHITYLKHTLISLIFGDRDSGNDASSKNSEEEEYVLNLTKDSKNNSNKRAKIGYNTEIPICENGHPCSVCLVSSNSAGFMCAYCAKLYTSDADLLKQNENILQSSLHSRIEVTLYKWCCMNCHYDVCLHCFPHSSYPSGGQLFPYLTNEEDVFSTTTAFADNIASNNQKNIIKNNKTTEHMPNITTKRMICLIKSNSKTTTTTTTAKTTTTKDDEISCKVRREPSITSIEVSRIPQGSVIEVVDSPKSTFFYIENIGYIKKNPGKGAYWKRLPKDRYMYYPDETPEISLFLKEKLNKKENNNMNMVESMLNLTIDDTKASSSSSGTNKHQQNPTTIDATTATSMDILDATVRTIERLIEYDQYLKQNHKNCFNTNNTTHISNDITATNTTTATNNNNTTATNNTTTATNHTTSISMEHLQEKVLRSALELFTMTVGEGLGELVLASMDRCDDASDDFFIASERLLQLPLTLLGATTPMTTTTNTTTGSNTSATSSSLSNQQGIAEEDGLLNTAAAVTIGVDQYITHQPASAHYSILQLQTALYTSTDFTMKERFSLFIVQQVFSIVVSILTNLAERRITSCDTPSTTLEDCGFHIIEVLANSEYHILLNTYFYRIFIAKAGIRCKFAANIFLSRINNLKLGEAIEPTLDAFKEQTNIESAYKSVLLYATSLHNNLFYQHNLIEKFQSTFNIYGYSYLSNRILEMNRSNIFIKETGLKKALQLYILQAKNRIIMKESISIRKLLKLFCLYSSEENINLLEALWKEVLSEYILEYFIQIPTSSTININTTKRKKEANKNKKNSELLMDNIINNLIKQLHNIRYISKMDMSILNKCNNTTELAFIIAFKRLSKEQSIELTKSLVVRISSLIDTYKTKVISRSWAEEVEKITDFIQVIYTQSSEDFQHFYELLLARRLLLNRHISINTEKNILQMLPAMSKSVLMLNDIDHTTENMKEFFLYLIEKMDFSNLKISNNIVNILFQSSNLNIHTLTANIWPMCWLQPIKYASLILPHSLNTIKTEFISFFHQKNMNFYHSMTLSSSNNSSSNTKYNTLKIIGSQENAKRINGIYKPTVDMNDGWPIYEMSDTLTTTTASTAITTSTTNSITSNSNIGSILEYSGKTNSWHIKKRSDRGKNAGWAYCKATPNTSPDCLDKPWYVWKKSLRKWVPQPIRIVLMETTIPCGIHFIPTTSNSSNTSSSSGNNNSCSGSNTTARQANDSMKKLIWCHAAGTLTLQTRLDHEHNNTNSNSSSVYIVVTEPQAAVLYSFNTLISAPNLILSFEELQTALNLSKIELITILQTCMTVTTPLLERVKTSSTTIQQVFDNNNHNENTILVTDRFQLSTEFLTGKLGGSDENKPLVLTSIEYESQANNKNNILDSAVDISSSIYSLYNWRNDLIDACIVRTLKQIAIHKTGEFPNIYQQKYTSLPLDTLTYQIRCKLKEQCKVTDEDIMRRSEHLVNIGIIEKVLGNTDTFRSIAYCYLPENFSIHNIHDTNTTSNSTTNSIVTSLNHTNYICDRVYGQDLFNHLRIVLGIKTLPSALPGIPFSLFKERMITWLIGAYCTINSNINDSSSSNSNSSSRNQKEVNILDSIAGLLIELTHTISIQINTLKLQYWYGIQKLTGQNCPIYSFVMIKNLDSLKLMSNVLNTSLHNTLPNIHHYLYLDRIYLEYLPELLIQDILNYFRSLIGEKVIRYQLQLQQQQQIDLKTTIKSSLKSYVSTTGEEGMGSMGSNGVNDSNIAEGREDFNNNSSTTSSSNHTLSVQLKREIQQLWHRSEVVYQEELLEVLGCTADMLNSLNIVPVDSWADSKEDPYEHKRQDDVPAKKYTQSDLDEAEYPIHYSHLHTATATNRKSTTSKPLRYRNKYSYASTSNRNNIIVKLSFQQLIAAVFVIASKVVSREVHDNHGMFAQESLTLADLLDECFFKRMIDAIANIFGTELHFEGEAQVDVDQDSKDEEDIGEDEEVEEVYIPCEFCTDSIRMSLFEAHTIACQAGRVLPTTTTTTSALYRRNEIRSGRGRGRYVDAKVSAEEDSKTETEATVLVRPSVHSQLGLSLIETVLNKIVATAAELQTTSSLDSTTERLQYNSISNSSNNHSPVSFTAYLEELFSQLDRDKDGFLTAADFATSHLTYSDLQDSVDPIRLYGPCWSTATATTTTIPTTVNGVINTSIKGCKLPSIKSLESLNEEDIMREISTPIALGKVSSLWQSVSNEKSLPIADSSRSYAGLEEAELELNDIINRVKLIIDDSEGTSLSLLVYYKWDSKTLVEEVIENSRAVRFAAGLGPRNMPPFLRYDLFSQDNTTTGSINSSSKSKGSPSHSLNTTPVLDFNATASLNKNEQADSNLSSSGNGSGLTITVCCGICQDNVSPVEAFSLHCHHWYCGDCWQGYIHNAINERQVVYHCPHPGCQSIVTSDMQGYFADEQHIQDAKAVLIKSFVEDRRGKHVLATYCKNPRGCAGIVLLADDAVYSEASCCLCSTTFCAACDLPPHAPATCDMVARWEEKGGYIETGRSEDVEARKLKHLTTKPCPKCGVRIEKSGGCPHMTCVQPSCKYQFCWECAGEYHTSTTCSRPKVKPDSNSVLAFDEYDRQCANHFLARKVALKGKTEVNNQLEQTKRQEDMVILRILLEGWNLLADMQSALAHTCILMFTIKSAKLQFLFEYQKAQAIGLQQKFEETWTSVDHFPLSEAKSAIRDLRFKLRDYLLTVHTEIMIEKPIHVRPKHKLKAAAIASPVVSRSPSRVGTGGLGAVSPQGRKSRSASITRPSDSAAALLQDQVCVEDRPLLELLLQQQKQQQHVMDDHVDDSVRLTPATMVEIASTVFGDALGGSWRQYSPFQSPTTAGELPSAAVSGVKSSSSSNVEPISTGTGSFKASSSSPSPRLPPPPVRSFAGVLPVSFTHIPPAGAFQPISATVQSGTDLLGMQSSISLSQSWLSLPPENIAEEEGEEDEDQLSPAGFQWHSRGEGQPEKRPRK